MGVFDLERLGVADLRESPDPARLSGVGRGVGSSMMGSKSGPTWSGSSASSDGDGALARETRLYAFRGVNHRVQCKQAGMQLEQVGPNMGKPCRLRIVSRSAVWPV